MAEAPEASDAEERPEAPPGSTETREESPEEVLALQYRLINAGDYEGAYALFSDGSKQLISPEQYRTYFEENAPYSITDYSFPSVSAQDNTASAETALTANSASGRETYQRTQQLVREGGAWRIVMRDEQASAFAAAGSETAQYEESERTTAPADEEVGEVFVRVTGDPGISFQGNVGTLDGSRTVEGTTPQEFAVEVDTEFLSFDSVSALVQNSDGAGTLTVQIVSDGEVVKESTTTAQYGVADVNWSPSE